MKACGLLGRKLGHSYSPKLHARLADYDYRLFEVEPWAVAAFLQDGEFHGLNVTIPYKETVLPLCQALSPRAAQIGSVNTILRRLDGTLWGDNTDAEGFEWMLRRSGIAVAGCKVLVLGDGGAARAVRYVLAQQGAASVVTVSRRGPDHYGNLHRHGDAQVIVNTTPLGMYPDTGAAAVSLTAFPRCHGVLDLIYNPARTALLLEAARLGIKNSGGLPMLVGQARAAATIFGGIEVPVQRAEQVLAAAARDSENLILVGMPGCGKTTIGRALAQISGRDFVDADREIAAAAGCDIPTIFQKEGESGFRARETTMLRTLGSRSGCILATGGGCVTREENEDALRQNGRVVFLTYPIEKLAREGRPLSEGADLTHMYEDRAPLYRRFADFTAENQAAPQAVAEGIWREFCEIFSY